MQARPFLLTAALILGSAATAHAALFASDNASNPAYAGPGFWQSGDNGGTGFGPWTLNSGTGNSEFPGHGIQSSAGNDFFGAGNIDTGTPPVSFLLYDFWNGGGATDAQRPFTGDLAVGQTFNLSMDNGGVDNGRRVGFQLRDALGNSRFEFSFEGGNVGGEYDIIAATTQATDKTFTTAGMTTAFTLTGIDTFSFTVDFNDAPAETFTCTLGGTPGSGVALVRIFNDNANGGSGNDAYFNSMSIVPEPATLALGMVGLTLVGLRRRQH